MSALSHLITKSHPQVGGGNFDKIRAFAKSKSEFFWAGLTFILFMMLGPFAIIPVAFSVMSLVKTQGDVSEPESIAK